MERLGLEDYVAECHLKCAHIILASRIYQQQQQQQHKPPAADRRSGRWFLLEIEELAGLTQQLQPWRRDVYAPLIIEVSIQPWDTSTVLPGNQPAAAGQPHHHAPGNSMLLERWTLSFSPGSSSGGGGASSISSSRAAMDTPAVYKRLILLIRSLYSYVRVLPAYRMYRACKRHGAELFNTSYSLSTTADPALQQQQAWGGAAAAGGGGGHQLGSSPVPAAAGGGGGGRRMCSFAFTPVDTLLGCFHITVDYQHATAVHILEQTTIPVSMPRIISNYVDGQYARSAPHAAQQLASSAPGSSGSSSSRQHGRGQGRASGPDDPLALLRASQQQHGPLVRHSWSSRDVSGPPVVQRGFAPAAASGQQQQHRRTSSQGSGATTPRGAAAAAAAGGASPVSCGRPPLPHSPAMAGPGGGGGSGAAAAAAAAGGLGSYGSSSQGLAGSGMLAYSSSSVPSGGYYGPALPGSSGLPPASPSTPTGSSLRVPLFRSSSLSAAAALGAAGEGALAAGAAAAGLHQSQAPSRLGSSPLGQQQQHLVQRGSGVCPQPLSPQLRQQGFHVKTQEQDQVLEQPADVATGGASSSQPAAGAASLTLDAADGPTPGLTAAEAAGGSGGSRVVSAPVSIPQQGRSSHRASSMTDLAQLDADMIAAGARASQLQQQQQQLGLQQVATDWQQHQAGAALAPLSLAPAAGAGGGVKKNSSSSGLLQAHHHHLLQQQLLQQQHLTPSSAPAAPRGMLGQLLSAAGSGQTSPAFSPKAARGSNSRAVTAAAAVASGGRAATAAGAGDSDSGGDSSSSSDGTSSATADSVISSTPTPKGGVIIIRPTPPQHMAHMVGSSAGVGSAGAAAAAGSATGAGTSPSGSSGSSLPNSLGSRVFGRGTSHRALSSGLASAAAGLGAQPGTPGAGPYSYMGSSPQLPFAFTPSMGGSLLSMADAQRQLLSAAAAAAGAGGGLLSSSRAALPAPAVARTGSGSASAAAAAATGSSASPADAGGGAAAGGGGAAAAFGSIGSSSTQAAALGTPSPPLHAPQLQPSAAHAAAAAAGASGSGGHVSFIRDITGLATIRRPSWSSRSSSFDIAAASLPHHLSMSPGMDLLDPGLMMGYGSSLGSSGAPGSRPPAMQAAAAAGAAAAPAVVYRWNLGQAGAAEAGASAQQQQQVLGGDGSGGDAAQPMAAHEAAGGSSSHADGSGSGPALGVSSSCAAAGGASAAGVGSSSGPYEAYGSSGAGHDDSESDLLPFVLDSEPLLLPQQHGGSSAPAVSRIGQQAAAAAAAAAAGTPGGGAGAAGEHDVAVGAFLKLVQEAGAAPVGRLDRRQALWQQQTVAAAQQGGGDLNAEVDALKGPPPVCVGDAALQVQQLAAQLRVLLFPET